LIPLFDALAPIVLRWLNAHIEDDVKIDDFLPILQFPSNLLHIEHGVTTFGKAFLASFEITKEGLCYVDEIHLGSEINLGNLCTIMPGARLSPKIIVGSLTLVTRRTVCDEFNGVLLGIPARQMPFLVAKNTSVVNGIPASDSSSFHSLLLNCLNFFICKCLFITLYSSLPFVAAPFIHASLYCAVSYCFDSFRKKRTLLTFSEVINLPQRFLLTLKSDFHVFVGPYLSGTQFLVFLFRALGAQIGSDVILPDIMCLSDPHLLTIGDHVRLNMGAYIVVRHDSVTLFV